MATNIDKALTAAPLGLGALAAAGDDEPVIEIELPAEDDSEDGEEEAAPVEFGDNLMELVDASQLNRLSTDIDQWVEEDKRARVDWEETYKRGLELLGLKYEERNEPWQGACGVTHPIITEAVVKFQSETIMETFPAGGPVMTKLLGEETEEKKKAAQRVRADMNHQLTDVMIEYRSEHEKLLWNLSPVGAAFKKVYYDAGLERPAAPFVPAEDILLPYGASNVYSADRVTHVMRKTKHELELLADSGFYDIDTSLGAPNKLVDDIKQAKDEQTGFNDSTDEQHVLYEVQVNLRLKGLPETVEDGPALPYIVTKLRDGDVIAVRRNWKEDDALRRRRHHFVQYDYVPGFGAYGYGLFHLVGGYAKSATSILRQLVDAGTLSNLPGGLKAKGLRIKGEDTPISPGEWRDVDVISGVIRDNILPLPYKEPSAVLAGLLDRIVEDGRRLPGMADMKIADMSAQTPVGTTLALLERQLKVMSAVQARVHAAMKFELQLLKDIIAENAPEDYDYETDAAVPRARRADFEMVEVVPVSDPSAATMTQRVVQYQAVHQLSQTAPQLYDLPYLHRQMLEVMGIKNASKIVKTPDEAVPTDPVSENMNVLMGKPVKAFLQQDHQSHIAVHQAAMQDPTIMQLVGQSPNAQAMMAAAQAHIAEHAAFLYRQQIQQAMGIALPEPGKPVSPEQDAQLSALMAQAAQQVLQQHQQQAQAQQAQQIQQDPQYQLAVRALDQKDKELKIEEKLADAKIAKMADDGDLAEKKAATDAAHKADQTELAEAKLRQAGELGEQANLVKAAHVGVMGRAQDQELLLKDREYAAQLAGQLKAEDDANNIGVSGDNEEKSDGE